MDSSDDAFWKKKLELARAIGARSEPVHLAKAPEPVAEPEPPKKKGRKLSEETKQKLREARVRQTERARLAAAVQE